MAREDFEGAPIEGVTGDVAGSTTSDAGSVNFTGADRFDSGQDDGDDNGGVLSQQEFFADRGITETNPYGSGGFFTRLFGIDPSKIDYSDQMDRATRLGIMNNMYSKYANPFNDPNQPAYNPAFASGDMASGLVREGVRAGQTVVDPATGQETTIESFRAPQGLGDLVASGAATAMIPGAGLLIDRATRVEGLAGQPPMVDGQRATELGGGITGILDAISGGSASNVRKQGGRLLDAVSAKASEILDQGSSVQQGQQQLQQPIMESRQDIINRVTPAQALGTGPRPDVNLEVRPSQIQQGVTRDGIMDALGVPQNYQNNAPRVSGLAAIPTEQTADASGLGGLSFGEALGAVRDSGLGQAIERGIRGESVIPDMNVGGGKLGIDIDPMGSDKGIQFNYNMPLNDFGLGGLLSQNQPQAPADQAFDVAQNTNFLTGNYRGSRTQNQGGNIFGVPGTSGRVYRGSGSTSGRSGQSRGNAGVFDKMAQMFSFGRTT